MKCGAWDGGSSSLVMPSASPHQPPRTTIARSATITGTSHRALRFTPPSLLGGGLVAHLLAQHELLDLARRRARELVLEAQLFGELLAREPGLLQVRAHRVQVE